MKRKIYMILVDFKRQIQKKKLGTYASSTAFFFFLSLVPMFILLCTILPFTGLSKDRVAGIIVEVLPQAWSSLFVSILHEAFEKSIKILSFAALVTLWSAGKGMLALIRGLNAIHEVDEKRNYFMLRIIASFNTFIMMIAIVISISLSVLGRGVTACIITFLFCCVFTFVPNKKLNFFMQLPGAVFSAIVWSLFSYGFSVYIELGIGFRVYGSLTIIVILMLWLYFGIYILLIGAQMNRYFGPVYHMFLPKERRT